MTEMDEYGKKHLMHHLKEADMLSDLVEGVTAEKADPKKKSALLIEVMGWKVDYMTVVTDGRGETIPFHEIVWTVEGNEHWINLFNVVNMGLVWRVLNWASSRKDDIDDYSYPYYFAQGVEWLFDTTEEIEDQIWAKPPEEAIRILLDQVFSLCVVEAGIIELEKE